jgi:hypothetical protein
MRDHFGIGLGGEMRTGLLKLVAQLAMVLDDPVVNNRNAIDGVRMRVLLIGTAVRCPAGVTDANSPGKGVRCEPALKVDKLADRAAPRQQTAFEGCDAGRIISAILEPLQRIQNGSKSRALPDKPDNPTHCPSP